VRAVGQRHIKGYDGIELHRVGNVQAGPKVAQDVPDDEAMTYGRSLDLGYNKLLTARSSDT
jgi:hypothetical protein